MEIDPEMHDKWTWCIDCLMQINHLKESSWNLPMHYPCPCAQKRYGLP